MENYLNCNPLIIENLKNLGIEFEKDTLGNILCYFKEDKKSKTTLIFANYDQPGFLVDSIEDRGFLSISPIGKIDKSTLYGSQLVIHGKKNIIGICGAKPPHLLKKDSTDKHEILEKILIDTGYLENNLKELVSIGDGVCIKNNLKKMLNDNFSCASIGNKAIVVLLLQIAKNLTNKKHRTNIILAFGGGQFCNHSGLYNILNKTKPDNVLFVEIQDIIYKKNYPNQISILKTPIIDFEMINSLIRCAKSLKFPHHLSVKSSTFDSLTKIAQNHRDGAKVASLLLPVNNYGAIHEAINVNDIKMLSELISNIEME
jgi:endoglucanase